MGKVKGRDRGNTRTEKREWYKRHTERHRAREIWFRGQQALRAFSTPYRTASERNVRRFGRDFSKGFPTTVAPGEEGKRFVIRAFETDGESVLSVVMRKETKSPEGWESWHYRGWEARIGLGFTRNSVIIEVIQGNAPKSVLASFEKRVGGTPWPNDLLARVEEHARRLGFKRVEIRVPESLHYFHYRFGGMSAPQYPEVQAGMRLLYRTVASVMGYKLSWNHKFFVKNL